LKPYISISDSKSDCGIRPFSGAASVIGESAYASLRAQSPIGSNYRSLGLPTPTLTKSTYRSLSAEPPSTSAGNGTLSPQHSQNLPSTSPSNPDVENWLKSQSNLKQNPQ
jgi:hypothetical protein